MQLIEKIAGGWSRALRAPSGSGAVTKQWMKALHGPRSVEKATKSAHGALGGKRFGMSESSIKGHMETMRMMVERKAKAKQKASQVVRKLKMKKKKGPRLEKIAGMSFTRQDRPAKVKEIYRALKRDEPGMSAAYKARIAAKFGKKGVQKKGRPYTAPPSA